MVNLQTLNTFGISVHADQLTEIHSAEQLQTLCGKEKLNTANYLILGGGSNVLFKSDFKGCILLNRIKGINIVTEDSEYVWLKVNGGESWHAFVMYCTNHGWGGVENLALIPGTVGAAPIQNIGAYGVEVCTVIENVQAIELATGLLVEFSNTECQFGYRDSIFKHDAKGKYFIISVVFKLNKNPKVNTTYGDIESVLSQNSITDPGIKDVCKAVIEIRSSKLPDPNVIGNAGSFFKNPVISNEQFELLKTEYPDIKSFPIDEQTVKIPAAWLIEQTGWKGKRIGNVGVHQKQALVLINYGEGKGNELLELAYQIIDSIKNKFNITLNPEVNII